jgi:transposase
MIINIIETHKFICGQLEIKNVQLKRLLKQIFGIKSEKTKDIINDSNSGTDNNSNESNPLNDNNSESQLKPDTPVIDDEDKEEEKKDLNSSSEDNEEKKDSNSSPKDNEEKKESKKGHGKNGIDQFTGADTIEIPHPTLKNGDPCPECHNGRVYNLSPGVFVYIKGNPPINAEIYKTEKLRCNLCGAIFEAKLPNNLQGDPYVRRYYDETAKSVMIVLKYGYGVPLNRIEKLQENMGVPMPISTQWDKIEEAADTIHPVFTKLKKIAAQGEVIHNDDTIGKILEVMKEIENEKEAGIKGRTGIFTTGIICVVGDIKIGLFFTGRQHAGENAEDILSSRDENKDPPLLMSDAKSGNVPKNIKVIACNCNTHARRNFVDILDDYPEECQYVISEVFEEIYRNDAIAKDSKMSPDERLKYHQENSGPIMDDFHQWLNNQMDEKKVEPNSTLGKAISYTLKHWDKLTRFLQEANAPIDNNICERAIKTAICHRKNSLFYKNEHGAYIGDMFMSLIHTCNLNGVNAFDYLTQLQKYKKELFKNPEKFLPWNYKSTILELNKIKESSAN